MRESVELLVSHERQPAPVVVVNAGRGVGARRLRTIVAEIVGSAVDTIVNRIREIITMNMTDLETKLAELQAGQTKTLQDVETLIANGDTSAAIRKVQALIDQNAAMDAEIQAALPPAPPADGGTPVGA